LTTSGRSWSLSCAPAGHCWRSSDSSTPSSARTRLNRWPDDTRHYYDIYQLLGDDHTLGLLRDRIAVEQVMRSISEVSESFFGGGELRPADGWARSPAFDPDRDSSRRLRAAYAATMADLYFGPGDPPPFNAICSRVAELGELL
jgi:hypothetical protein